ncbi:MAG: sigma-E factor negative regulatory protein [Gammaproteobacteria bacterium]|jgi:sigma-E factor negative regulatory protein RseA|nr:sigma-E factor negative regulatory protein [Gammaproteobacteria bacterium]
MSQIDSENSSETISALLDNEADDLELRRFLKSCEQDPTLLETWERYSLVQSALHESAKPVNVSLSQRIAEQIEQEAPLSVTAAPVQSSWKEGFSKMAIAASVAAVFLVSVQLILDSSSGTSAIPAIADQSDENIESPAALPLAATTLLAEAGVEVPVVVDGGIVRQYIESLTLDDEEPVRIEHIQDSPLYRLVNELQEKP